MDETTLRFSVHPNLFFESKHIEEYEHVEEHFMNQYIFQNEIPIQLIFVLIIGNWISPNDIFPKLNTMKMIEMLWIMNQYNSYSYLEWAEWIHYHNKELNEILVTNNYDYKQCQFIQEEDSNCVIQ